MARKLTVEIVGDASSLERAFHRSSVAGQGFGRDMSHLGRSTAAASSSFRGLGQSIGTLSVSFGQLLKGVLVVDAIQTALRGLHDAVHLGIAEFSENAKVTAQTNAAIKSTGEIANVTAKHIDELGLSLSNLSGIDDEAVRAGENVLLSFTNIRDFAGKHNQIFTEATKAVVDYASRTGKEVPAAALILGRALQDPARRVASLSRAGIVFSASQQKALAALQKTQGILAAQQSLLKQVETRYKGAAEAAGKTLPGQLNILRDRFKDLAGSGIGLIAPAVSRAATGLTNFVKKLSEATGVDAKFHIIGQGLRDLNQAIVKAIGHTVRAIVVNLPVVIHAVGNAAAAVAAQIYHDLGAAIHSIDWAKVWANIQGLSGGLLAAIRSIDWKTVGSTISNAIDTARARIGELVRHIDWRQVASRLLAGVGDLGRATGTALVASLNKLADVLNGVNWQQVGKAAVDGLGIAIALIGKFLISINWRSVAVALVRALGAALKGAFALLIGIAGELGRAFVDGIKAGFSAAWNHEKLVIVKDIESIVALLANIPTSFKAFGKTIGVENPFKGLDGKLKDQIALLEGTGQKGGTAVGAAITAGVTSGALEGFGGFATALNAAVTAAMTGALDTASAASNKRLGGLPKAKTLPLPPPSKDLLGTGRKGLTATQRNSFFDSSLARLIDRSQDGQLRQQLAKLQSISGLITARIAATKDVTRKLNLEDKLIAVGRQIKGVRDQIAQGFIDTLQLGVTKAQATSKLGDDLSALAAVKHGIEARIKDVGRTNELQNQLLGVISQIKGVHDQIAQQFLDGLQLGVTKAQATVGLRDDLAALAALKQGVQARIKAVGGTNELEGQLLDAIGQIKAVRQQQTQNMLDALNLRLDKAAVTSSQNDDLATLNAMEKAVRRQIKTEGDTLDLERQLFDIRQKRIAARNTARNARQFTRLGLTAAGDTPTPGVQALKRTLGTIDSAVTGSFLDTKKTRSMLQHIRQVLSGGLGAVGKDVRDKVKSILDDIDQQLKQHAGDQTRFRHVGADKILAGLGLTPEQMRQAKYKLAQLGPGQTVPSRTPAFALAGGGPTTPPQARPIAAVARTARALPAAPRPTRALTGARRSTSTAPVVRSPASLGKGIPTHANAVTITAAKVLLTVPHGALGRPAAARTSTVPRGLHNRTPVVARTHGSHGAAPDGGVHYHGDIHIHHPVGNPRQLEDQLQKRTRSRANVRRGT